MQPIFTITKHNNMKKIALAGAALLLAAGAQAQMNVRLGVEAGLNISNLTYDKTVADLNTFTFGVERTSGEIKLGGKAGLVLDLGFSDNLSLQPGLFYSMKGYKDVTKESSIEPISGTEYSIEYTLSNTFSYLELPINVAYRFGDAYSNTRFMVYGGPYVGYAMGGRFKGTLKANVGGISISQDTSGKISTGNTKSSIDASDPFNPKMTQGDDIKSLDYGFQVGAGVEMGMGLFFKAQYQMGLANLSNGSFTLDPTTGMTQSASGYMKNWCIGISVGYFFMNGNNRY